VIFTTAYADYALEGYELNVVDYLLKPFSYERFNKAIKKVNQLTGEQIDKSATAREPGFLIIKEKEGLLKIAYDEILYVEASKDYMKIFTNTRQYLTHLTMKKLEDLLPAQQFIRTHKSFIVALQQIKLLKTDSLVLANNITIPVSLSYKEEVMRKFRS
jgi:DNA-binding LytR/AlgR family response regulator